MPSSSSSSQTPMTPRSGSREELNAAIADPSPRPSQTTGPVTPPRGPASALPAHIAEMTGTPLAYRSSTAGPYTSNHHFSSPRMQRMASEMSSKFVGHMSPMRFLDEFLPRQADLNKPWKWDQAIQKKLTAVANKRKETDMYQPLIDILAVACGDKLVLVNSGSHVDKDCGILVPEGLKPDVSAYEPDYKDNQPVIKVTDFSLLEFHMEFKKTVNDDGFDDVGNTFERTTENGIDTRGQIATYATAQLGLQFRTHVFSVLLCGTYARFIRWDRTGAIVSSRFNYAKTDLLLEFVWRFALASPEVRGRDLSVSRPTAEEAQKARSGLGSACADTRLLKFTVVDDSTNESLAFVGNEPVLKGNSSPVGRATRTFKVWDLKHNRIVLLKDTWRVDLPGMEKEGEIYKTLHEKGVPRISDIVCAGDVHAVPSSGADNHRTRTHWYGTTKWLTRAAKWKQIEGLRPHSHYRIVLGTIGTDLTKFASSKILVTAARDALRALVAAYRDANIMHRDISVGNIMIVDTGGLLIDWDLAKRFTLDPKTKEPIFSGPRQSDRSGTWQFISAWLLQTSNPRPHTLADDMESLLHVLNWVALRYMPHAMTPARLDSTLYSVFDASHKEENGQWAVDTSKESFLTGPVMGTIGLKNEVMKELLIDLAYTFAVQYIPRPPARAFTNFEALQEKGESVKEKWSAMDDRLVNDAKWYLWRVEQRTSLYWMEGRLTEAVDNGELPDDDPSIENKLPPPNESRMKRKLPEVLAENDRLGPRRKTGENGEFISSEVQAFDE
ncbi:hypothetical protein Hypma_013849 [Hypsizygus marmoreus]|uniref:Fungal-type protein kinase domain-containing protein n=1 Tax=Hypsizygus marmoreus TaxID=39966 RepID=A0A369KGR0_HYPMA|nr:hypothetical protein Hypma_013849 [Hypsizygus marmoreus]